MSKQTEYAWEHTLAPSTLFDPYSLTAEVLRDCPPLFWWPLWAGVSRSGDLGFTSGPYSVDGKRRGYYFTVWARQADGSWKWLMDAGPPSDPTGAAVKDSEVAYARLAARQAGSPGKAMAQVNAAEVALHAAARTDVKAAFLAVVADDGRIAGSRAPPPRTRVELETELASRPLSITYARLGGQASQAGDLVWTYGVAQWTADRKSVV